MLPRHAEDLGNPYNSVAGRARTYGDLLESAFDVHRNKLYEAVRWAKPANAAAELQAGRELTEYLLRGSDSPALIFSDPARS